MSNFIELTSIDVNDARWNLKDKENFNEVKKTKIVVRKDQVKSVSPKESHCILTTDPVGEFGHTLWYVLESYSDLKNSILLDSQE